MRTILVLAALIAVSCGGAPVREDGDCGPYAEPPADMGQTPPAEGETAPADVPGEDDPC